MSDVNLSIHAIARNRAVREAEQAHLDRRERIATAAMLGILSNGEMMTAVSLRAQVEGSPTSALVATNALAYADTLILHLDATP